jgi:hypothetical protein
MFFFFFYNSGRVFWENSTVFRRDNWVEGNYNELNKGVSDSSAGIGGMSFSISSYCDKMGYKVSEVVLIVFWVVVVPILWLLITFFQFFY